MSTPVLPTIDDVRAARERIKALAVVTPLINHPALDAATGGRILLKLETLQRVGAFKFRGAYNAVSRLDKRKYPGGVVACSSGNHAQGVAAAATLCGMPSVIVMPSDAPRLKLARTKAFGAEVITFDRATEDRDAIAHRLCEQRHAAFVHPFDDFNVIAGQGTVGLELMEQSAAMGATPAAVLAPASGGGLVTGISLAVKAANLSTGVYAVEPAGFDDFKRSLETGVRQKNAALSGSICDALMAASPGELTFAIARTNLAGSLIVTEGEVRDAMRFAFLELKLVVEPGGAAALAAILSGKLPTQGRTVAAVISGGNADPAEFAAIVNA